MSVVTSIIVLHSCSEFRDKRRRHDFMCHMMGAYGEDKEVWPDCVPLREATEGPLIRLWGGDKAPQFFVWIGAVNYCPHKILERTFLSWPWKYPEDALLVYKPEEGAPVVVRAGGAS